MGANQGWHKDLGHTSTDDPNIRISPLTAMSILAKYIVSGTDNIKIHHEEVPAVLAAMPPRDAKVFLRQAYVDPGKPDYLMAGNDESRFVNHGVPSNILKSFPTTSRDIMPGEELLLDYSSFGNPEWYQALCARYGVLTEHQVAER